MAKSSPNSSGFSSDTKTYNSLTPSPPLLPPENAIVSVATYCLSLRQLILNATALIDSATGHRLSYYQFTNHIKNLSSSLQSQFKLSKGDVAFILSPNSIHVPILYFSLLSLGVVISPSNPTSTHSEISRQISLSNPVIAFATSDTCHKLPTLIHPTVLIDSPHFMSMATTSTSKSTTDISGDVCQADLAAIMYSSGTTGQVKGVMLTHRNLTAVIANHHAQEQVNSYEEVILLCILPYFHGFGFFNCLKSVALRETVVVMVDKFELKKMLRTVEEFGVTNVVAAPPVVAATTKINVDCDLKSLKGFRYGGAPLGKDAIRLFKAKFPNVLLMQGYGMTEASGPVFRAVSREECSRLGSVGRLQPNFEARIVDPQTMALLPPGKLGELWLKGPMIMKGYVGDPKATCEALSSNGWLKTGDLCYFDVEGFVYIVDRLKELIKYKGYQVPPAELEQLLQSYPEVVDSAVIPYPDEEAGEVPMALVVKSPQSNLDEAQIMGFVAKQVAPYKKIRRVLFINSIPRNPAGKILRKELRNAVVHQGISSKL